MKTNTALGIALLSACLTIATGAQAGELPDCAAIGTGARLICDTGGCVRVSSNDLCQAIRTSYEPARRPARVAARPRTLRDELTVLILRNN